MWLVEKNSREVKWKEDLWDGRNWCDLNGIKKNQILVDEGKHVRKYWDWD